MQGHLIVIFKKSNSGLGFLNFLLKCSKLSPNYLAVIILQLAHLMVQKKMSKNIKNMLFRYLIKYDNAKSENVFESKSSILSQIFFFSKHICICFMV